MYAEPVDTLLYDFVKPIYITENGHKAFSDIQVKLDLSQTNFNFNYSDGTDIRFAEKTNGSSALYHWVASWDVVNSVAVVWIRVPYIGLGETKTVYMFFGSTDASDFSNYHNLGFKFVEPFNSTALDPTSWYCYDAHYDRYYSSTYGLRLISSYTSYIISLCDPLANLNSWELFLEAYYQSNTADDEFLNRIFFNGPENGFYMSIRPDHMNSNLKIIDSSENYSGIDAELDSYNDYYIAYNESNDIIYLTVSNRNNLPDQNISVERSVNGNTRLDNIKFIGPSYSSHGYVYYKWLAIREYIGAQLTVDYSELFFTDADYSSSVIYYLDTYSEDLTSSGYYHYSDCGGDASKLSDNITDNINGYWYSTVGSTTGSVIIDFARSSDNKVSRSYVHFDSGHINFYNASKLSDSDEASFGHTYWAGLYTSGNASIDFETGRFAISCLGLKALDGSLGGMVKNFKFQGGYGDPRRSSSSWVDLYEGLCTETTGWQVFYFVNNNKYRYYRLLVTDTYGDNIRLAEWCMYESMAGFNIGKVIQQIRLLPIIEDSGEDYFPKKFAVYGSNDFSTWDTIDSSISTYNPYNPTVYGRWQRYNLDNYNIYRAYKFVFTEGNWAQSDTKLGIAEWELVQTVSELNTNRVLWGDTNIIKNIWAEKNTTYDGGWLYCASDGAVQHLYDYRTVKYSEVSDAVMDITN